jgi:hypothetical protein
MRSLAVAVIPSSIHALPEWSIDFWPILISCEGGDERLVSTSVFAD